MALTGKKQERLDALVVREGLAVDLHTATALILAGKIMVGERKVTKAGEQVRVDAPLRLLGGPANPYVSRGGLKLAGALRALSLDVTALNCADIGASTGGFTDCLLQHGAAAVVAVDVGHGLLHDRLRRDPRVHVLERTHARALTTASLPWLADLIVVDVSFIGVRQVLPALVPLVRPDGLLLLMVKPQFELPRDQVPAGGVVRDDAARWQSVAEVEQVALALGCKLLGRAESELAGPSGNREIFVLAARVASQDVPAEPWL